MRYKIVKINKINCFKLQSSNLRSYYHKNILAFGDLLHTIHPLAGQGFNMSIRDIKSLIKIIDYKINEFRVWLDQNHSDNLIKSYRGYIDDITDGVVIKSKKMLEAGEDIDMVISFLSESLKNKLTHETTAKLKEILPLIDKPTALKVQNIFKKKE